MRIDPAGHVRELESLLSVEIACIITGSLGGNDMGKEPWIVFFGPDGKELLRYTLRGTFAGELQATISYLAYTYDLSVGEISFAQIRG